MEELEKSPSTSTMASSFKSAVIAAEFSLGPDFSQKESETRQVNPFNHVIQCSLHHRLDLNNILKSID